MGKIKDIYEGDYLTVWEDEGTIYLSFPWSVVVLPKDNWEDIKKELAELTDL